MSVRESLDDAVRIIKEAIQSNLNDYLAFEITQKRKAANGKGRKFQVVATCGARELATFELDLSVATSFPDNLDDTAPLPGVDFTGLPRNT